MKDDLNLINREERREMLSLCIDQGTAVILWSPLARGRLTRVLNWSSSRVETDLFTIAVDSLMKTPSRAMTAPYGWMKSRRRVDPKSPLRARLFAAPRPADVKTLTTK